MHKYVRLERGRSWGLASAVICILCGLRGRKPTCGWRNSPVPSAPWAAGGLDWESALQLGRGTVRELQRGAWGCGWREQVCKLWPVWAAKQSPPGLLAVVVEVGRDLRSESVTVLFCAISAVFIDEERFFWFQHLTEFENWTRGKKTLHLKICRTD